MGQRVLSRAVAKLQSLEDAATYLGVSEFVLRAYLEGRRPVPDAILLKAVDLVMDDQALGIPPAPPQPGKPKSV